MFCDQFMKNLVIVESPTKARTLSRFLGNDYLIEATMGHIRDLPEKKLGIVFKEQNKEYIFSPLYEIIPGRKKRVMELKKLAKDATRIILATDPDREGEAIAYHVSHVIRSSSKFKVLSSKLNRIVFHEITNSAIKHALVNPREIDMQLVDAQQARRILDRLVGYKLSPLLWSKIGKRWLSAGRVQTVAVRLIVEREREIENFVSEEYWVIDVELKKDEESEDNESNSLISRLVEIDGKKAEIKNKEAAEKATVDLKVASYTVAGIEIKEIRRNPAPPFTTSTLQQAASNRYGWSAKRTMRTAQGLYEQGFITYHRTDSTNLAKDAIEMVRTYINNVYGKNFLPQSSRVYKTKSKVAQEAHEAIRPTDIKVKSDNLKAQGDLGRDASTLYDLIWKRFVACQMNEAVIEQTTITVRAQKSTGEFASTSQKIYLLKTVGERMKFIGWLTLYGVEKDKELPLLNDGEKLDFINIFPLQKFTEPPSRYTEATLIKALEEKGIGRPSTYAPIISTIEARKYTEKIERRFFPTELGKTVNDFLVQYFPDVFDIGFTAKMEDELDEIANGKRKWNNVISEFYAPFSLKLDSVFKKAERVKMNLGTTTENCPKCKSQLVVKLSKYGKFLACSNYPQCTFTKNIIEKIDIQCPKCKGDMVVKKTRRGKQFYGCSNYPTCHFAVWKKEDIK